MKKRQTATRTSTRNKVLLLIAAAALIVAIVVARQCAGLSVPLVDPVVSLERQHANDSSSARTVNAPSTVPDEGEVYRTADRLREASAVALAAALYAANEQANRHAQNVESVIAGIRSAGLLPPNVTVDGRAMLQSRFARLSLRFRSEPLGIEVMSQPHSRQDGPALMVRIPGSGTDGETGSVFIADRLGEINAPAPFASISDCVRAGWIDQPINQTETPREQQQQLRVWLATRRPQ